MRRRLACLLLGAWPLLAGAETPPAAFAKPPLPQLTAPRPGAKDLCPVCGMLVAKYPPWVATIVQADGSAYHFDGAKDLFKFWFEPARYAKDARREKFATFRVTEYYGLRPIDAKSAHYVVGSAVLGPMGHEFVPLASRADAEEFMKEHKGRRILRFDEITPEMPRHLDKGKFDF